MTGQDGLRDELIDALINYQPRGVTSGGVIKVVADDIIDNALLPVVQARIDAAREQVATERVRPLLPAEHMVYTVAREQIRRGDNPPINITAVLLSAVERLSGIAHQRAKGSSDE